MLSRFAGRLRVRIGTISLECTYPIMNEGVPQGTMFGPIGFVHHVNDLWTTCDHVKYVGDCTVWETCSPSCVDSSVQTAADEVVQWTTTIKHCHRTTIRQRKCAYASRIKRQSSPYWTNQLHSPTSCHNFTRSYVATPHRLCNNLLCNWR